MMDTLNNEWLPIRNANDAFAYIVHLEILLAHAVTEADGWHDDSRGGKIKGDQLISEARKLVAPLLAPPSRRTNKKGHAKPARDVK